MSPVSTLTGLNQIAAARPRRMDAAQRPRRCAGRADAARGAARIEQPRRDAAAAADRHRPRAELATRRPRRPARRAVAGARHGPRDAAGDHGGLRGLSQRRPRGAARDITRVRDADGGTAFEQRVETERVISPEVAYQMVSMLRRRDRSRHRRRARGVSAYAFPPAARPARPTNSRMRGSSASHRRWSPASGSASISRRRSAPRHTERATRCRSGRTSCSARRACGAGGFRTAGRAGRGDAVRDQLSQAGRRLPDLHRIFQGGRRCAGAAVHAPSRNDSPAHDAHGARMDERSWPPHQGYLPLTSSCAML